MNFLHLLLCSLFLTIAVYGAPMSTGVDSEIRGEVETPAPTRWQGAWESAKGFFNKISGYLGGQDTGTLLQRIGQATTFYNMLRENPQQLIDNLKNALNQALSNALLNNNPQKQRELQAESAVLQKQLQHAMASVNQEQGTGQHGTGQHGTGSTGDTQEVQVRTMVPEAMK